MPDRNKPPKTGLAVLLADAALPETEVAERRAEAKRMAAQLTPLEADLLGKLAAGWSRGDIVSALGIDETAYEGHRACLFGKINASSTAGAVRVAIYADLA